MEFRDVGPSSTAEIGKRGSGFDEVIIDRAGPVILRDLILLHQEIGEVGGIRHHLV